MVKVKMLKTAAYNARVVVANEELTVDAKVADSLIERGMAEMVESEEDNHAEVELSGMKVDELIEYAKEAGIDLGSATKKADIIAAIEAGM